MDGGLHCEPGAQVARARRTAVPPEIRRISANHRVASVPSLLECLERVLGVFAAGSSVDGFQVADQFAAVVVADEAHRVSNHVHDARLHFLIAGPLR